MSQQYLKSTFKVTVNAKWSVLAKHEVAKIEAQGGGTTAMLDAAVRTVEAFIAVGTAMVPEIGGASWPDGEAANKTVDEYNALIAKRKDEYTQQGFLVVGTQIDIGDERWDQVVHDRLVA